MDRNIRFSGGVHPKGNKNTHFNPTIRLDNFKTIRLPMSMHIGPPCTCIVKPGDLVKVGQLIGAAEHPMSVPIHSSVSGVVKFVRREVAADGRSVDVVEIESDLKYTWHESVKPPEVTDRESFINAVRSAGLVGLGGAAFPTHVKLSPPAGKEPKLLIVNAAECEPYITADFRQCMEHPSEIIDGILLVMKYLDIPEAIIAVENNKPEAANLLEREIKVQCVDDKCAEGISVSRLRTIYPTGAEKMMIYTLTGKAVPSGGLPHDIGVLVLNVSTVRFIYKYLETGMPLVRKRLTLDGSALKRPGNVNVPIGAVIKDVVEEAGGTMEEPAKVLMGGPMMGVAVDRPDTTIIKQNNAIIVFGKKEAAIPPETQCIHCARCVNACPMRLMPTNLDIMARNKDVEGLEQYHIMDCIECGCCSYVCPAKRYLVQSIRNGKSDLRTYKARMKEAAQ
ncbi:MAG: electron transport complex subunit RsxC [Saccharofermentanales bacterium]|jgi:electron transport complex protein RnfC